MRKISRNTSRDKARRRRHARVLWEAARAVSDVGRRIPGADAKERKRLRHELLRAVGKMHAELDRPRRR